MKTRSKDKVDMEASLVQLGGTSEIFQTKISDLTESTATTEADLNDATVIRAKKRADFELSEQEFLASVSQKVGDEQDDDGQASGKPRDDETVMDGQLLPDASRHVNNKTKTAD